MVSQTFHYFTQHPAFFKGVIVALITAISIIVVAIINSRKKSESKDGTGDVDQRKSKQPIALQVANTLHGSAQDKSLHQNPVFNGVGTATYSPTVFQGDVSIVSKENFFDKKKIVVSDMTPEDIIDEILKQKPALKDSHRKLFFGKNVTWLLTFSDINELTASGKWLMFFRSLKDRRGVYFEATSIPSILNPANEGDRFYVAGKICSVNDLAIELDSVEVYDVTSDVEIF